ncbi:hypothetical protein [Parabacteroides timonensis]|uniref:hypothetical protein n=1 Tax=Parabacteroides timonensis TaxID=1871013 RepID=UPI00094ED64F|nr:hypothetical protein [Parabacteroides timonensis]
MKHLLISIGLLLATITNAQIKDTFDSNSLGWTEASSSDGEAVIRDGVMHMESKKGASNFATIMFGTKAEPSFVETHTYGGFDPNKDFEITCEALVKKIDENNVFGIMLDYIDEGNFLLFVVTEQQSYLYRFKDYQMVGRIKNRIKLKSQKKVSLDFKVKSSYQRLQFYVNDMLALEARYLPLTSSGIGFYVFGKQTVDFDNLEIKQ